MREQINLVIDADVARLDAELPPTRGKTLRDNRKDA